MTLWKAILTYDGTPYHGWQVQPCLPTVQGTLAQAIRRITGESVLPQGSGRTDTGVHALAQVASFSIEAPIPPANFHRALNRALPSSIRVLSIEPAPSSFHARHSALRKTYEYRIFPTTPASPCSPMLAPFVWDCHHTLDLDALQQAASQILGTHDFTSFAAADPDLTARTTIHTSPRNCHPEQSEGPAFSSLATSSPLGNCHPERSEGSASLSEAAHQPTPATNIRTIHHSAWHRHEDLLICRITGTGFLHHMVRNLVGSFVEAAIGRIPPDSIPQILAAHDRSAAGPTAPARGLFLVEVVYP